MLTSNSLSVRLAFVFFISVTTSISSSLSTPKATVPDLLALLGSKQQAAKVDNRIAQNLKSCFKFLVPFTPGFLRLPILEPRRVLQGLEKSRKGKDEELVLWPSKPVMEFARLAVDSGGDPGAIQRALDPTMLTVSSHTSDLF